MATISDFPPCPAGFSVVTGNNNVQLCANAAGWTPSTLAAQNAHDAANNAQSQRGLFILAGAAILLLFAPGAAKLLALPLGWYGLSKSMTGLYV